MKIFENKPKLLQVRLTNKQYAFIDYNAKLCGFSIGEWLRMFLDSLMPLQEDFTTTYDITNN